MGVKKSTVWTRAISSVILYTPASSAVEVSTKRFGSCCGGSSARACPNPMGLILEAQPAQATRLVSFHCFCLRNIALSLLYTSSKIDWRHTVAYRTRFCPCFSIHTMRGTGPFSSRSSPRLPGPSTPSPLAGEGWDGGEKHGLGTPLVFTPTLALPRLRGREKTDRRGSRKLHDPDQLT